MIKKYYKFILMHMTNKKKKIIIAAFAAGIILIGVVIWALKQNDKTHEVATLLQTGDAQSSIVFYYGQECSHCQNVEKFIKDNSIEQKVIFDKKEVWHNTTNNDEFQEKAKECALDTTKIGVPFLFARGKCYVGEVEVEDFFKKESGMVQ